MVTRAPGEQLLGRQRERDVLDRVLEAARDGHGGVLAVYTVHRLDRRPDRRAVTFDAPRSGAGVHQHPAQ